MLYSLSYWKHCEFSHYSGWLQTGQKGFNFQQRKIIFLLAAVRRLALGPTQFLIQWVPVVLTPGGEVQLQCNTDHSHPFSAEQVGATPPLPLPPQAPPWCVVRQLYFLLLSLLNKNKNKEDNRLKMTHFYIHCSRNKIAKKKRLLEW